MYVDDIKLPEKKQNIDPMWKVLNKQVDLGEPTSSLDHVYLECTQMQCETRKDIVDNYRTMFESRISAGAKEKTTKPANTESFYVVPRYGRSCQEVCVERYCELANKTTQQLYKVSTPCIDDHQVKEEEEEMKSVGEMSDVCSQMVLKCVYLARIGRPDILWSVNKLARAITKWTRACDKRLARLITYIHFTSEHKQYCHVGNTAQQCQLDCFKTLTLQEILKIRNRLQVEHYAYFEATHLSQQVGCARNRHVYHTVQQSLKKNSPDLGLRMDGIPTLDLGELVSDVFHSNSNQKQDVKQARCDPLHGKASEKRVNSQRNNSGSQRHLELSHVDFVSSNMNSTCKGAMLYICEDNEAVIKMIKCRSPTPRHVSRTHNVALDWLFGRINADLKIQIRCVDSNNQLADILTKGHFTRDEWNHLLCLFNISLFSSQSCSEAMTKRPQEGDYEEKGRCQNKTGEKFGIEKPCRDLNSAIFDGIIQSGDFRT